MVVVVVVVVLVAVAQQQQSGNRVSAQAQKVTTGGPRQAKAKPDAWEGGTNVHLEEARVIGFLAIGQVGVVVVRELNDANVRGSVAFAQRVRGPHDVAEVVLAVRVLRQHH